MSVTFNKRSDRQRAARALARLNAEDFSSRDLAEAGAWKSADSVYRQEYLRTAHLLADMEGLKDSAKIRAILDDAENDASGLKLWPGFAVAATMLLAVAVGYLALSPTADDSDADGNVLRYVTRVGEQKSVELSDGSHVTLNTGSELLVSLSDQSRALTLVRGEAYFDVASDPLRPFWVGVGTRRISVLGTQFNVRKMPDQFSVAVIEGVISFHKESESVDSDSPELQANDDKVLRIDNPNQYRLSAGWVVEFDNEENVLTAHMSKDLSDAHSWRQGLVSFAGAPFYQVVRELNRYSGKKILIEDSGLVDIEVFASVRVDRINAALASLERAYPIKLVHYFDRIGIVSSEKNGNKSQGISE